MKILRLVPDLLSAKERKQILLHGDIRCMYNIRELYPVYAKVCEVCFFKPFRY